MPNEKDIIRQLRAAFPLRDGIGDDAAILPLGNGETFVIGKDLLAEDVHFRLRYFSAADLAHKALEVNLSDIAAMGARADNILLGLSLPRSVPDVWLGDFLSAFAAACHARGVTLIGGDTTASADKLFISITALGRVNEAHLKRRNGARPGDIVCVAGDLGYAHLGLAALENGNSAPEFFLEALRRPVARLAEGAWLAQWRSVTAMMDVSDGLAVDLGRLCAESGCGATLDVERLPENELFLNTCAALGLDPLQVQLAGGEDCGLLLTVAPEAIDKLAADFLTQFGFALHRLGAMKTGGASVILARDGQRIAPPAALYSHFGESD